MTLENDFRLSFYQEIAVIDQKHNVKLVQHRETGKIYVCKTLRHYDRRIYEVLRRTSSPGIPAIHEIIEDEGTLIVLEDYVNGKSLEEHLKSRPFSEPEVIRIIQSLANTLAPFHACKPPIIHRDIKPSNIILDNSDILWLIDFDASKVVDPGKTRDTELIGTQEYAAPEQYGFGQSDQRTDIYAIGILMNKLLTGKFPSEELWNGSLKPVIQRATRLDPAMRFSSLEELCSTLSLALSMPSEQSEQPGHPKPPGHPEQSEQPGQPGQPEQLKQTVRAEQAEQLEQLGQPKQSGQPGQADRSNPVASTSAQAKPLKQPRTPTISHSAGERTGHFSRPPRLLRELPGIRSDNRMLRIAAFCWYVFIILLSFVTEPDQFDNFSGAEIILIDCLTFVLLAGYTLYLGNYLGVRDRLPFQRSDLPAVNLLRILLGCLLVFAVPFAVTIILSLAFGLLH